MTSTRIDRASVAILALSTGAALLSACGGERAGEAEVAFGFAAPLEQYIGSHALRGAELARDHINADGGIRGRSLAVRAISDSANPERAVRVAERFFTDPAVVAVIGHLNSGSTLAAATIYNRGLAAVSPSATSPGIGRAGPWIFRVASSDAANSAWLARFAARELGARAAILYANEPYGRGLREGFGRAYVTEGGTLLEEYPYIEGRTQSFEPYLLGIKAADAELIFVAGLDVAAGRIIRQARDLNITLPILGGDGLMGLVGLDSVFDGTYVGLLYHPEAPGSGGEAFGRAYEERFGEAPDHFAALAYDAMMLTAQAAREVGFEREDIRAYLEQVGRSRPAFEGVTGRIAFDESGDPLEKKYAVGRISGDAIELVSVEGGT